MLKTLPLALSSIGLRGYLLLFLPFFVLSAEVLAENYERDGWPEEGRPILSASNKTLVLRREPKVTASTHTVPYSAGWKVPFAKSFVRTVRFAPVTVRKSETISIWCGKPLDMQFLEGQNIEYLQYWAEGEAAVRVNGMICSVPIHTNPEVFGSNIPLPETEWWVQVAYADGTSPGWLLVRDDLVEIVGRSF